MHRNSIARITAGVLLAVAGSAQADTKSSNFTVSTSVAANCFVSATPLSFGTYTGDAAITSESSVNVRCTKGAPFTLLLSTGSGTYAQRLLKKDTDQLEYNLYLDDALTTRWGDGTDGTSAVSDTGDGLGVAQQITHTVYGELVNSAANQAAPEGPYSDTITVTVDY